VFKRVCGIGGIMADKIVAKNKKAYHEYFIEDKYEAGLVLVGTEVKSIRQGKVNLKDSYVSIKNGEAFVYNMHISPYEKGNIYNVDPLRPRKLLLNKRELRKLVGLTTLKGYSLIPLSLYLKNGLVKMELSVAKGKKTYDKRQDIAKKDAERRIQRQDN
jgi:SsrA-binding protein